ncbi:Gfo/Idh/MocA family protein [Serinibacter salmoneus]|uniref:Putative dehydrogenase n=1 Tax=Serinibacter salmoneus TaxID=556530 RepID=A0A2A9CXU7_9MICO|nr:Gfo/Idh/MocA family oxidoreductase [Serinibacter salmoneus]PFG18492.1 putative dehydrogenase [Serinibacter salmoneus]
MTYARLGVGMVGYSFMGAVHAHAWNTAPRFFTLPLHPELTLLAGRNAEAVTAAAARFGFAETTTDWRTMLTRDDVDLVDVCTPGDTHAEIAIAALEAGKHVLCEKPLANSVAEAEAMAAAAASAAEHGVRAMVGFTYRRVPAIQLARQLVAEGALGQIRHVRADYLQDWLSDPSAPLSWRLDKSKAGSGALGDIGAHVIDLAQFITGEQITAVTGMLDTFVAERPIAASAAGLSATAGEGMGPVTVDDSAAFLARLSGGGNGVFTATRFAQGRKNAIRIEINGSRGSLAFDFEDMNVLHVYDAEEVAERAGFRRIVVTEPGHPFVAAWWPPGHGLGYEHGFTHQAVDLVTALAEGSQPTPSFADGLAVQRVLDAVERSAATGTWLAVSGTGQAATDPSTRKEVHSPA